jgi:hydrogenase expression/formation protein HypE
MPDGDHRWQPACPPQASHDGERITLAYGEGGRLTRRLIQERIVRRFGGDTLAALGDAALIDAIPGRVAISTDGYTVTPLFFPGGDIGRLAVFGTINDLVVSGARPRALSLAMVIEEGLPWATLDRVLDSVRDALDITGARLVTGDTKVVPRGAVDQLFLTTTGIGAVVFPMPGPAGLEVGDAILVSGPIGRHGAAVLCSREDFGFDPPPVSDCGSLLPPIEALWQAEIPVRCLRDATRGGVAAVLHEWAIQSGLGLTIDASHIPVTPDVRAVCELLGLDALHLACEGTFVAAVAMNDAPRALETLHAHGCEAAVFIGDVTAARSTPVRIRTASSREIPLDEPAGSPLPRIC